MTNLSKRIRELSRPMVPRPTQAVPVLQPLAGIRVVLFDIYGTLLISGSGDVGTAAAADSAEAMSQALTCAGYELSTVAAAGVRGVEAMERAVLASHNVSRQNGILWPEVDILRIWQQVLETLATENLLVGEVGESRLKRLALEYECRVNPVWPMPGLEETLAGIRDQDLCLGIVSNAQFYTPLLFSGLLGKDLPALGFDERLCVWSYRELQGKPSAQLFGKVTATLKQSFGISPDHVLYVGNDMRNDIAAAARAGCRTALFAGDSRSLRLRADDPFCQGVVPDLVVTQLPQLLSAITSKKMCT